LGWQAILIRTSNKAEQANRTGKFKNLIILILSKFIKSYLYSMTENQLLLLKDAQVLVTDLLTSKLSKSIRFHTLRHTQDVVAACEKLADSIQLPDEDRFALIIAAWFHDTGYTSGNAKDHETISIQLATDFLNAHAASDDLKNKVIGCINATRIPQSPKTFMEGIICDADLFHLGTDDFKEKSRLLREEFREFSGKDVSKKDWRKINIRFLEGHQYFTAYGKEKLQPIKEIHLAELKQKEKDPDEAKSNKKDKDHDEMKPDKKNKEKQKEKFDDAAQKAAAAEAKAKKAKESQTERGINTVFRIMAQNQNNLTGMADSKANIIISVNSIILSIVISQLVTKLDAYPNLLYPVLLLVGVCVSAIIFAILATRPNVNHGKFTEEDVKNKKTNLLFFGNFFRMGLKEYDWAMDEMLKDRDYLYSSIVKDNYFLGVVLARKYRFLRIAYNIFMYGLILVIIAFALSYVLPVNEHY
jgi:predicted metal-dependent HD superfamily phosphohydrolase